MRNLTWAISVGIILALGIDTLSFGQGFQSTPYAAAPLLRRESLDLPPNSSSNPLSSQSPFVAKSNGFLSQDSWKKDIPNLQMGYEFYSGKNWRVGYFTLDYLLPIRITENSIVFGAAHSELQGYSTPSTHQGNGQAYLSAGGGLRTMLGRTVLVGVNGFYDAARYSNRWLSSGGAGLEWAVLLPGHDAFDLNINWYGDLFNEGPLVNNSRNGLDNFELQAGYSHQLFNGGPDLRLYGTAYKFDDGTGIWGWQTGIELKSANGVLSAKCQTAHDPVNDSYQMVSAFVNIGFQPENLLKGRNPFVLPEPIFSSPRNFNRLTEKVRRNWRHTTHGVSVPSTTQTITVVNNRSAPVTLYMGFIGAVGWGQYSAADFPGFAVAPSSCNSAGNVLYRTLNPGDQIVISFDTTKGQVSPAFSADSCTWNCTPSSQQTLAEFTLQGWQGDWMDISLVNGFNYPMEIAYQTDTTPVSVINVDSSTGNINRSGVYPLTCDLCNTSQSPGCGLSPDSSQCSPDNQCQLVRPYGANYILNVN